MNLKMAVGLVTRKVFFGSFSKIRRNRCYYYGLAAAFAALGLAACVASLSEGYLILGLSKSIRFCTCAWIRS